MKSRRFTKELTDNGYVLVRVRGSHFIYQNKKTGQIVSVNKDLNEMVERRLRKETGLL